MRLFQRLAAAIIAALVLAPLALAADKPLVIEAGQVKQLPVATTLQLQAPTTAAASLNLPHGAAPTSPNNGDCWTTTAGLYCRINGGTVGPMSAGGGSPGGSSGQIQYNNAGAFGGFTLGGDCTFSVPNVTCTKTGGASFAASATTDTTSASNISAGSLALARIATIGADTLLGNLTGSTAAPSASSVPDCHGSTQALTYNTSTHALSCNTINSPSAGAGVYEAAGSGVPLAASFSWVNQGDATVSDGVRALLLTAPSNAAVNIRLLCQSAPAAPYTIYLRAIPEAAANGTVTFGLGLRDSTTGRLLILGFESPNATSQLQRLWQRWASATSFNATISSQAQWTYTNWQAIQVTSTTATPLFSPNGADFSNAGAAETLSTYLTAAGGTADQVCIAVQVQNGSGVYYVSVFQTATPN